MKFIEQSEQFEVFKMVDYLRSNIQKLNGENYSIWGQKMELLLIREDLWDVVKEKKPADKAPADWDKKDDKARATIGLCLEDNQLVHMLGAKSAYDAWEKLKNHHQKSTLSSKVFTYKKLFKLQLAEGGDMDAHVAEFLMLVNKLTALGETVAETLQASMLLCSLPESYSALITSLECRDEKDFTIDIVKGRVLDEYKRRKASQAVENDGEAALNVSHNSRTHSSNKSRFACHFCKSTDHFKKNCPKYKKWKSKKEQENSKKEEEKSNIVIESTETAQSSIHKLFMVPEENVLGQTFLGKRQENRDVDRWYVDTGATSHMCTSKDVFVTFDPSKKGHVELAELNKSSEVQGIGSAVIKCIVDDQVKEFHLKDVLYIPSLSCNLISGKKLAKDGFSMNLSGDSITIIKSGKVHAVARLGQNFSGLYAIKMLEKAAVGTACVAVNIGEHTENCQHVWHRRFGHRDPSAIKILVEKGLASGIKLSDCGRREVCECCVKGKMARKPFPKQSESETHAILDLIHTDVCGPIPTPSPGKKRYTMTIIDDYSRYTWVYFLKEKSEVNTILKQFIEMSRTQMNKIPKCVRSDRGGEYVNENLQTYLKNNGIRFEYTAPYSPEQNGVAERKNRSLHEMGRCMRLDANLEEKYWAEAVNTANFLQNRLPSRSVPKTPFEIWHSRKPDVRHLHIFGCDAYAHVPNQLRRKLDEKAQKLTFIGYCEESKAFRLLDKRTGQLKVSRDVVFLDTDRKVQPASKKKTEEIIFTPVITEEEQNFPAEEQSNSSSEEQSSSSSSVSSSLPSPSIPSSPSSSSSESHDSENGESMIEESESESPAQPPIEQRRSERSNRGVPPDRYMAITRLVISKNEDPRTLKEALSSPDQDSWKRAMDEEINSLMQNKTWELVSPPVGANIVTCKWVFKTKKNAEGGPDRYKARLVARGFSQKYGIDYDEVFAPVIRQTTFKILLAIAGNKKLIVKHLDAKTAFLNGKLSEPIYMRQPQGYEVNNKEELVCKLSRGLYGLKQAAKLWNDELNYILQSFGFTQSKNDPCLYVKFIEEEVVYIIVHVDDFLIASRKIQTIDETAQFLMQKFSLVDLGILRCYLGIEVRKNDEGIYCIRQSQYIDSILSRFALQDAKISSIPLDTGFFKNRDTSSPMSENEKYQQLIGALLYLAVNTRPDISASVTILSQFNKKPMSADWTEAKRIARYLKGTRDYELILGKRGAEPILIGYADADWAENKVDRKSNSGYVFMFMNATISWACRKQTCVAISSTEAEYIALGEASQECIWIRRLLEDFLIKKQKTTVMFEDNQSCLKLVNTRKFSNRTKHIDTKFHFVRDLKQKGLIDYKYCPTDRMLADMLTKPLSKLKLRFLAKGCGLLTQ